MFCEGWRPGVAARLGLGYDDVRARQPVDHLLLGVGVRPDRAERRAPGPRRELPGARGRARAARRTRTPAIPRVPIADLAAGTIAALCICAAWAKRLQTGEGERIDVAMADVVASWSGTSSGNVLRGPHASRRAGSTGYGVFACADGGWITLAVISEDHFWQAVCDALELADELRDARSSRTARPLRRVSGARSRGACARSTRDDALDRLDAAGAPVAPVLDPAEMAAHEQFRDAGSCSTRATAAAARVPGAAASAPARPPGPAPELGGDPDGWAGASRRSRSSPRSPPIRTSRHSAACIAVEGRMLMIVGVVVIAGLVVFLVKSRKQTAKSRAADARAR